MALTHELRSSQLCEALYGWHDSRPYRLGKSLALHELRALPLAASKKAALACSRGPSRRSLEITLVGDQLQQVILRHPLVPLPLPDVMPESALERSERIIKMWRRQTFISCWSASDYESHALWRVYCNSTEGVAVQTTLARLRESVGGLRVDRISYQIPGSSKQTPTLYDLVTKKRPMFSYEQEVRVVLT